MSSTIIVDTNFEGFKVQIHQTHILSLYIEDEWMGELIIINNKETNNNDMFAKIDSVSGLFKDEEGFYNHILEWYILDRYGMCYEKMCYMKFDIFTARKLIKEFNNLFKKYDTGYEDNFRVALTSDINEMNNYKRISQEGCCGSVDEIVSIDGKEYMIGFNYGH